MVKSIGCNRWNLTFGLNGQSLAPAFTLYAASKYIATVLHESTNPKHHLFALLMMVTVASATKPWRWIIAFGAVNAVVTLITIILTLFKILVYKLTEIQDSNYGGKPDCSSLVPSEINCRRFLPGEILLATNRFDDSLVIGWVGLGRFIKRKSTKVKLSLQSSDYNICQYKEQ